MPHLERVQYRQSAPLRVGAMISAVRNRANRVSRAAAANYALFEGGGLSTSLYEFLASSFQSLPGGAISIKSNEVIIGTVKDVPARG